MRPATATRVARCEAADRIGLKAIPPSFCEAAGFVAGSADAYRSIPVKLNGAELIRFSNGLRPETVRAIEAVERALELGRDRAGAADITSKGERDLVTATDVAVEDAIRDQLRGPAHPVVGEERGGEAPADGSPYWLVDPICGTRNFASGIPLYCVNVALVEDHQVTCAVVGDGSTGEVIVAERGRGAFALEDGVSRPLATSAESQT